jgi:hypothetical protein
MTLEELLIKFSAAQKAKLLLPENIAKGGWEEESFHFLIIRLREEVHEIMNETFGNPENPNLDLLQSECADVANFAMMIFDNCETKKMEQGK